jgi:hypothetical protein
MTTTMNDCLNGHWGNWQSGMFVRYDYSHVSAKTTINEAWDGYFQAPCPHGVDVWWRSLFGCTPQVNCDCR